MLPGITPALFGGASLGNDQFTVLLCHFDGPNSSTQILDSSPKQHGIATVSGPPYLTAGSPLTGGVSVLVLSANGYISYPNSSDWEFGAGDFTVDWWEYRNAAAGCSIARDFTTTYCPFLLHFGANGEIYMTSTGNTWDIANGVSGNPGFGPPTLSVWRHMAVTRQGSTFRAFVNGVQKSTWTSAAAIYPNANPLSIGGAQSGQYANVFMDELRISKGIARWTANFTPPTKPYAPNPDTTMKLLLHFDAATGLNDSSVYRRIGTAQGPAAISTTQKKFSDASFYEPANCWVSFPNSPDWDFGAGEFTIEWWEYRLDANDNRCMGARDAGTYTYQGWMIYSSNGHVTFYTSNTGTSWDVVGLDLGTIDVNTWVHRAVTRKGSTFYGFKNGVLVTTATSSLALYPGNNILAVGLWYPNGTAYFINGYIDEFRIDSVARYTASFTPPVMPYGANPDTYATKLLLHFDGPNGDTRMPDASQFKHGFATISGSTAKVTTAQSKFGVSAYSNDGSTSYASFPDSDDWNFQGDFTIDLWVKINALPPTSSAFCFCSQYGGGNEYWLFFVNETGNVYCQHTLAGTTYYTTGPTPLVVNQWAHVAIVRSAGVQKVYVNGVGGAAEPQHVNADIAGALQIGVFASGAYAINGYMDELRISNGIARWTANFTPPTAPYDPPLLVLPGPATPQTIAIGSGSQWTVPADWTSGLNSIEVIGGGGGGGGGVSTSVGAGGGGGGYAKITNLALTPGAVINYVVGAGGGGGPTGGNGGGTGGQTWFNSTGTVCANGGAGGGINAADGGAGGGGAAGATLFTGGTGWKGASGNNGGGGGGAAGPNGNGVNAARGGSPGIGSMTGGAGDAGAGGAGGASTSAQGGAGTEWGSWGSGGGGCAGNSSNGGGAGGAYGGGGAGANRAAGGQGLQGLIIIKYG